MDREGGGSLGQRRDGRHPRAARPAQSRRQRCLSFLQALAERLFNVKLAREPPNNTLRRPPLRGAAERVRSTVQG